MHAPKKTIIAFLGIWFMATLLIQDLLVSLLVGLGGGVLAFFLEKKWPAFQKKQKIEKVEAELPFVLLEMSIELTVQRPFEKILERVSQSAFKNAKKEFQKVFQEIHDKGASVPEALRHLAERLSSTESKRAIIQLIHAYEQGTYQNKGANIKRIAQELLSKQRIQAKAFSSKLGLFSLIFIVVSAIVPALFQSFVLVGSSFLSMDFSPLQVLLIIAVAFPLLDLGVLWYIKYKTPIFLGETNA